MLASAFQESQKPFMFDDRAPLDKLGRDIVGYVGEKNVSLDTVKARLKGFPLFKQARGFHAVATYFRGNDGMEMAMPYFRQAYDLYQKSLAINLDEKERAVANHDLGILGKLFGMSFDERQSHLFGAYLLDHNDVIAFEKYIALCIASKDFDTAAYALDEFRKDHPDHPLGIQLYIKLLTEETRYALSLSELANAQYLLSEAEGLMSKAKERFPNLDEQRLDRCQRTIDSIRASLQQKIQDGAEQGVLFIGRHREFMVKRDLVMNGQEGGNQTSLFPPIPLQSVPVGNELESQEDATPSVVRNGRPSLKLVK